MRLKKTHWVVVLLLALWAVEAVNFLLHHSLDAWGIVPRTLAGLRGIVCAPFLHASVEHLAVNSVPLLVLGWLITISERADFRRITVFVGLASGALVWLFGRGGAAHLGASGLITGYLGFLLARGALARSLQSVMIALITVLLYGGLVYGLLPRNDAVSWEAHLFGFLVGIAAATRR
jgi:membrane associated rhomboid family serine protease